MNTTSARSNEEGRTPSSLISCGIVVLDHETHTDDELAELALHIEDGVLHTKDASDVDGAGATRQDQVGQHDVDWDRIRLRVWTIHYQDHFRLLETFIDTGCKLVAIRFDPSQRNSVAHHVSTIINMTVEKRSPQIAMFQFTRRQDLLTQAINHVAKVVRLQTAARPSSLADSATKGRAAEEAKTNESGATYDQPTLYQIEPAHQKTQQSTTLQPTHMATASTVPPDPTLLAAVAAATWRQHQQQLQEQQQQQQPALHQQPARSHHRAAKQKPRHAPTAAPSATRAVPAAPRPLLMSASTSAATAAAAAAAAVAAANAASTARPTATSSTAAAAAAAAVAMASDSRCLKHSKAQPAIAPRLSR